MKGLMRNTHPHIIDRNNKKTSTVNTHHQHQPLMTHPMAATQHCQQPWWFVEVVDGGGGWLWWVLAMGGLAMIGVGGKKGVVWWWWVALVTKRVHLEPL